MYVYIYMYVIFLYINVKQFKYKIKKGQCLFLSKGNPTTYSLNFDPFAGGGKGERTVERDCEGNH